MNIDTFWSPKSFKELAEEQDIKPIENLDDIMGGFPEDEDFETFLEATRSCRGNNIIEVLNPRDVIKEELAERQWTQQDLADVIGRPVGVVNRILNNKTKITPQTAKELGAAFGTGAMFWLNLETKYMLSKLKHEVEQE